MMNKMNVGLNVRDINHNNDQNHAWKTHAHYIRYFIDDDVVICICFFIMVILIDHRYLYLTYVLNKTLFVILFLFCLVLTKQDVIQR